AWREALRAFTEPAIWIAPENNKSFSVSVVLPASGCEMMAKVRRRRTWGAISEDMADGLPRAGRESVGGQLRIIRCSPQEPPFAPRDHSSRRLLSIHAVFSWVFSRCVSRSTVG